MKVKTGAMLSVRNRVAHVEFFPGHLAVLRRHHAHIGEGGPHPNDVAALGEFRHRLGVSQCQAKNRFIAVLVFHHRPPAFPNMVSLNSGKWTCSRYRSLPQRYRQVPRSG